MAKKLTAAGKPADGTVALPEAVFGRKPNGHLLWETVRASQANLRQGTAFAKSRGEVVGSRRKVWAQKHTGRARHGDRYTNIFRGGGVTHGPRPRDFRIDLPRKARRTALAVALSLHAAQGSLYVVEESLEPPEPKTKRVAGFIASAGMPGSVLFVTQEKRQNLCLGVRNLQGVNARTAVELDSYSVLLAQSVVFEKEALGMLQERLS